VAHYFTICALRTSSITTPSSSANTSFFMSMNHCRRLSKFLTYFSNAIEKNSRQPRVSSARTSRSTLEDSPNGPRTNNRGWIQAQNASTSQIMVYWEDFDHWKAAHTQGGATIGQPISQNSNVRPHSSRCTRPNLWMTKL